MKKIFFILSIVLVFFHPTYSCALKATSIYHIEIVQQESEIYPNYYIQGEKLLFDEFLIDIEDEDVNDSERKNFSSAKTAFKAFLFASTNFFDDLFKKPSYTSFIFHLLPSYFISLRVFRL